MGNVLSTMAKKDDDSDVYWVNQDELPWSIDSFIIEQKKALKEKKYIIPNWNPLLHYTRRDICPKLILYFNIVFCLWSVQVLAVHLVIFWADRE